MKFSQDYYAVRGWSDKGIPTKARLSQLKLETMIGELDIPD